MVAWWVHNLKYKELYEWYQQQPQPKAKRVNFRERVIRYWYDRDSALNPTEDIWRAKRCKHIVYDDNGRVCNKCWEYKKRDDYSYNKVWFHKRNSTCKVCKNKAHAEYRLNWWYEKDHEYKHRKRYLEKWDQIYFNSEIWEVQSYSMKKWYIVKSIVTWEEKRITTWDNHYRRNNSCVRFVKLENPVVLMRTKEKPQFEVKTDGETFELTPPPKEEKKFSIDLDEMLYWEYE